MVSADQALIGFYAINAHSVDYRDLPRRFARTRPQAMARFLRRSSP